MIVKSESRVKELAMCIPGKTELQAEGISNETFLRQLFEKMEKFSGSRLKEQVNEERSCRVC